MAKCLNCIKAIYHFSHDDGVGVTGHLKADPWCGMCCRSYPHKEHDNKAFNAAKAFKMDDP